LEQGLKAEIDSAKKIFFRKKAVYPGKVSYDTELKYIKSKPELRAKTTFLEE